MLSFVMTSVEERNINDKKDYLFTQANILSNQLIAEFRNLSEPHTNDYYREQIMNFSKEIDSRVVVVDQNGVVVLDSYDELSGSERIRSEEMVSGLAGTQDYGIYNFQNIGRVIYVVAPVKSNDSVIGAILISSSLESIYESISKLMNSMFLLSAVCIGVTIALSFIFVQIISAPIEKLTDLVNKVSYGRYDEKIELEGNDEIKVLSHSFNSLMTKLDTVDTQRKQFVANVSHELRTPLTSIKLLSSSLLSDEQTDPNIYKEFLQDIDKEVDRLNEIIDSQLYLVDLEKKELELRMVKTQINFFIKKVIERLRPIAIEKNITIRLEEDEFVYAMIDKAKIDQCLTNLIANAIKYNNEGGLVIIRLINLKSTCMIQVIDNGIGIDEEHLPHVFDRFYRADKARARQTGGTGLGLSIVQQIVNLHQGEISIESQLNSGTTVTIELRKESYL